MKDRKIIHVDMDAFYASVEQRDHMELRGKPVVVGGDPNGRGVVASASYEARKFKIHSAMSAKQAQRLCPQLIFVRPDFAKYNEASRRMREIFDAVTDKVEPLSLDEAYLDVTVNRLGEPLASKVAEHIKARIQHELNLTASAGVGPNKFIAKVASDLQKPDGLVVIHPSKVFAFLETLPVEKLWGVGPVTAKRLHELGLKTAGQIRVRSEKALIDEFGKFGAFLHALSRGEDDREVESEWTTKSRGTEETFERDVLDVGFLTRKIVEQADYLAGHLKEIDTLARTLTLKVRYSDFKTITRSRTFVNPTDRASVFDQVGTELLMGMTEAGSKPIRLLGLSASGLIDQSEPLQLWLDFPSER